MCECKRIVSVNGKCNDLAYMTINHLKFEHDGYLPYVGKFGGDYIDINVCLDCGKIQDWQPVSDQDIKDLDEYQDKFGDGGEEDDEDSPSTITLESLRNPRSLSEEELVASEHGAALVAIEHAFGRNWRVDPKVKRWLQVQLESPDDVNPTTLKAIQLILDEL